MGARYNGAAFRVMRDGMAVPMPYIAKRTGVSEQELLSIENADGEMPDEACAVIAELMRVFGARVADALEALQDSVMCASEEGLGAPEGLNVYYYRDREAYASAHPEDDPDLWAMANAIIRAVGRVMMESELPVTVGYSDSKAGEAVREASYGR